MKKFKNLLCIFFVMIIASACSKAYVAKPVAFKAPTAYGNAVQIEGMEVAAKAFLDEKEAKTNFGFNIRKAGMLPVLLVFDNKGTNTFEIVSTQTILEESNGNFWNVLSGTIATERVTQDAQDKKAIKEGTKKGCLGAMAGVIIGAAIGLVTDSNVAEAAGKGAAAGSALGMTIGGAQTLESKEAEKRAMEDYTLKSLVGKKIKSSSLTNGFLFFPGEAKTVKTLRLYLKDDNKKIHSAIINF